MRKALVATTFLVSCVSLAHGQTVQTSSLGGMTYYQQTASGGCSAATPCSIVTYLGYQSEPQSETLNDLNSYFGGAFAQANPHTIVIAPVENGSQNEVTNWGGYNSVSTPEGNQVISIVRSVEASMGNTVNASNVWATGGSLGGTGTENFVARCGPNGTDASCRGLFSGGLAFAAALWTDSDPAVVQALCGAPLMAVHGTADPNQAYSWDSNLSSQVNGNSACGNSFELDTIQNGLHGVWAHADTGYQAGVGAGMPLGWLTQQIAVDAGASTQALAQTSTQTAAAQALQEAAPVATPTAIAAPSVTPTSSDQSPQSATIKPGGGSITDAAGNVWAITQSGSITKNGNYVNGGGGTSALTIGEDGTVFGQDNGRDGNTVNSGGWFTLSGDEQSWGKSAPPGTPATTTQPAATAQPTTTTPAQTVSDYVGACTTGTPNSPASAGGFGTINGQIYTPDGKPFIARGINIRADQLNAAVSSGQLLSDFPGINMIRLYFEGDFSDNLSSIQGSINALTAQGIVVEIEDHTGISKPPYTGSQLAAEQSWYSAIASANKTNPYVWFGTFNEPGNGTNLAGIGAQEQTTYNTIRSTGNNNPILMEEPSGGNPGLVGANATGYDGAGPMTGGANYGAMTNIIWDLHNYGWVSKYSTNQATVNAALQGSASGASGIAGAQTIQSADGLVPVIIGEFGPSSDGASTDPNGDQVLQAVTQSGYGYLAWGWNPGPNDVLTNGSGALTNYGGQIAAAIKSGGSGVTPCAVSAVPTAVTAPDLAQTNTAETAPAMAPAATAVTAPTLAPAPMTIDQVAAIAAGG